MASPPFQLFKLLPFLLLGLAAIIVASLDPVQILMDDSAIYMRYAERLVAGLGFTYNDHEHIFGASDPVYTVLLAAIHSLGLDLITTTRGIGTALFVASILITFTITRKMTRPWIAWLAALSLLANPTYRYVCLCGMDSGLVVVVGLLAIAGFCYGKPTLAGAFLGLAIWCKIDAGFLALALAAVSILIHKRFPWKIALTSLAVVVPWCVFAYFYFGTFIPQSLAAKLEHHSTTPDLHFNKRWILELMGRRFQFLYVALAMLSFAGFGKLLKNQKLTHLSSLLWFSFYGLALSLVNLGANYPWYLAPLFPSIIIAASLGLERSIGWTKSIAGFVPRVPTFALAIAFALPSLLSLPWSDRPVKAGELFDFDRRLAGIFLRQYADPHEVVNSGFGWVAYESKLPFNDGSHLNMKERLDNTRYLVTHGIPYDRGGSAPDLPPGFVRVADFDLAHDVYPGYSWFSIFAHPESAMVKQNVRHLRIRIGELAPPSPYSNVQNTEDFFIFGSNMMSRVPSGALFKGPPPPCPAWLSFSPKLSLSARAIAQGLEKPVRFEVIVNGNSVYAATIEGNDSLPVILPLPQDSGPLEIAFLTDGEALSQRRVRWENVTITIANSAIDLSGIESDQFLELWHKFHPKVMTE